MPQKTQLPGPVKDFPKEFLRNGLCPFVDFYSVGVLNS
jgi:hypothetical protein